MTVRFSILKNPDDQVWSLLGRVPSPSLTVLDAPTPRKSALTLEETTSPNSEAGDLPVWLL